MAAPTGSLSMNTQKITNVVDPTSAQDASTKAYVDAQVNALVDGAPGTLNTLNEIATAISSGGSFESTVVLKSGSTMTGALTLSGAPSSNLHAATKAYVDAGSSVYLVKASNLSDVANATTARGNLSAAKSGANSDITSITGLTTALTVAQGGTGAATHTSKGVLIGNGTSAVTTVSPSTSGNVLTSDGTNWTSATGAYALTSGTAQASTSGTSIDFTSIPSWVKRITIMFDSVSTNAATVPSILFQLGTSSGIVSAGYVSVGATNGGSNTSSTSGFVLRGAGAANVSFSGAITIMLLGSNVWVQNNIFIDITNTQNYEGAGKIDLGGTLDRVRITSSNGTDAFDAGTINILYE
jgi:hypothetical protein